MGRFDVGNIVGDTFALVTVSIASVLSPGFLRRADLLGLSYAFGMSEC